MSTIIFVYIYMYFFFLSFRTLLLSRLKPWSQVPSLLPPGSSIFIAHTVQQSHCSSIFHRVLLTHAIALSASQFVHPTNIYEYAPGGIRTHETDLYQDNLIRHRGDRNIRLYDLFTTALHMIIMYDGLVFLYWMTWDVSCS